MSAVLPSSEYIAHQHVVADAYLPRWSTNNLGSRVIQEQILVDCMWEADPDIMIREAARTDRFVAEVLETADRIQPYVHETPQLTSERLSALTGQNVQLKLENTQFPAPSFKVRTAASFMTLLTMKQREKGGSASSTGNYAQGVAYIARELGVPTTIFMPESTTKEKIEATKNLGGNVQLVGKTFDEAKRASIEHANKTGSIVFPPYDHPAAVAGNATVALETLRRNPNAEYYFVPVGGGGLYAGVAWLIKALRPDAQVIGVQEDTANAMTQSLKAGEVVELDTVSGVADALQVKQAGEFTLAICAKHGDGMINVSASEILTAHQDLQAELSSPVEKSGAIAVAGMIKYFKKFRHINRDVVAYVSGGSTGVA